MSFTAIGVNQSEAEVKVEWKFDTDKISNEIHHFLIWSYLKLIYKLVHFSSDRFKIDNTY